MNVYGLFALLLVIVGILVPAMAKSRPTPPPEPKQFGGQKVYRGARYGPNFHS